MRRATRVAIASTASSIVVAAAFIAWPLPSTLLERRAVTSLTIVDREGGVLREAHAPDASKVGRVSVPLENDVVPPLVKAAFVAAEDRRFDERRVGVDVRAIARALRDSIAAGHVVSGASTIEQQLARRLVDRPRTVLGKAQEALWALRLSAHLDKERLLVEYLNRIPLGNGVVGVEAASRFYFGRPARSLSPAQAALLAGLAHAPAVDDPLRHPERAVRRRNVILARMSFGAAAAAADAAAAAAAAAADAAAADPDAADDASDAAADAAADAAGDDARARAIAEPLDVSRAKRAMRAPHFALNVERSLHDRGLYAATTIETTIDPELQRTVETIVEEELQGPLAKAHVGQAAVIVVDNATGDVLAYAGSRDFFDADPQRQGANDGVRSRRQPGSALKPFVYGLALSKGMTASTLLPDVETTLATESGSYAPRNYDKRVHGPVRLRAALQSSYNIPAVHVAEELGPPAILDVLHAAGFDSLDQPPEHYGVGIVLGDGDVTLYEMARAYRGLANGGVVSPLVDVRAARDAAGTALAIASSFPARRFLPANAAALLTDILVDTQSRAPAFGLDNALSLPFPVAAKTGTSRSYVDNWTAGFTHERTVAVWAGNFDGTPMKHVSGITGAGVIFRRVMIASMDAGKDTQRPAPLVDARAFETVRICPLSGKRASPSCPGAFDEHFLAGTAPSESCESHHVVASSEADCAAAVGDARRTRALDVEPRYAAWARGEGVRTVDGAVVCDVAAKTDSVATRARLLSPIDGDELVREPGIPDGQGVPVKVKAPGVDVVELRTDGGDVVTLRAPFSTWIDAVPGRRSIALYLPGSDVPVDTATYVVR